MLNRPPPPLNYVRSFECSARHLSFTKAADELGYTQAAISVHIRSLERYLGAALFHRHPRSLTLTETGEAFLPTLRQALQMIDQATETVVVSNQRKTVTLSCPISLAENWLAPRIAGLRASHPDVELVILGTIWEPATAPAADLVISMHRDDDAPPAASLLLRQRLSLLGAPHRANAKTDLSALLAQPKIVVLGRQEYWTAFAEAQGRPDLDMEGSLRTNSTNIALEMAASGAGLTATPHDLARAYLDRGVLVELSDLRPASPWSYYLNAGATPLGAAAKTVRDWLLASTG